MMSSRTKQYGTIAVGALLSLMTDVAGAAWELNLQSPVTPIAMEILELHNLIMLVCLVIFVVVFGVMFYSVYAHRKSKGYQAAQFHDSTAMEIVWTIIPFVILIGMAIPSTATLINMEDTTESDLTVKITGYQWKWRYDYLDHDVTFFSTLSTPRSQIENTEPKGEHYLLEVDKPIVLPTNKKIRFLITANDVLHAWWVPKLGVKKDAIPGYINESWAYIEEAGIYRGQCAELCGKDHGFMPIVVEAVSEQEFDTWVSAQQNVQVAAAGEADRTWTMDELLERGKEVYGQCMACHGATGEGVPGAFPAIAGSAIATGPVDGHLDLVMNGKPGTTMQAFKEQLSDADIAAVITYQRNSFGNSTGDMVQPPQVKALR
ncbi:MAG: cytochrome c oxidase subunit II [Gammaproteobacteria bacterium]|nr:cytochrome c oxidase subunit II [Gammaproteobacteria bacterium]